MPDDGAYECLESICCHEVAIRYWDIEQDIDDELISALREEGIRRARECICDDIHSGELNCLYNDEEIRGWFEIVRDG